MATLSTANHHISKRVVSLDVPSIAASTVSAETFTVTGLRTDTQVVVTKPTSDTGLVLLDSRVSAADTLELTFWNTTGAAIDPAAQNFYVVEL